MTVPLEIEIALWYHTRGGGDYGAGTGDNNFDRPVVQEMLARMVDAGLLRERGVGEPGNAVYAAGPALKVYVNALCSVRWPVQQWVVPQDLVDITTLYER